MTHLINQIRPGLYLDSVKLMQLADALRTRDGVIDAAAMIGTPANRDVLAAAGLLDDVGRGATADDLIIAVTAHTNDAAIAALDHAAAWFDRPGAVGGGADWRPRTFDGALEAQPDSNLVLISVPGEFAVAEARRALDRGLHVLLFSDNVSLADERALKEQAKSQGLFLMGPDCGTALIGGVPVGFANAVPRGPIGLIGASGTGLQEVSSLIARAGGGVSHAIGVGGRDLHADIGGLMTLAALDTLAGDAATARIVIISKPPDAAVAAAIRDRVAKVDKPVVVCFLGLDALDFPPNVVLASTLKEAALAALGEDADAPAGPDGPIEGRWLRGLFVGGTLSAEAVAIWRRYGLMVGKGTHHVIDFGDDQYTRGRPHPMIDPERRSAALGDALRDPDTAAVVLDVVLGTGAHPDPAADIAGVLDSLPDRSPPVIASITGTDGDPQNYSDQAAKLRAGGVHVAPSNADAAAWAASLVAAT